MKLVEVLKARSGLTLPALKPCGFNGRKPCARWMKYTSRKPKILKLISAACVLRPALFHLFLNADHFVGQHFQPSQDGMQKCPLAIEDRVMKAPSGFVQARIRAKNNRICRIPLLVIIFLQDGSFGRQRSELLRPQQRINQVNEQPQRGDAGNDVIHRRSPSAHGKCASCKC
jgi:hypothetical protein